jgi:hypothetical protein
MSGVLDAKGLGTRVDEWIAENWFAFVTVALATIGLIFRIISLKTDRPVRSLGHNASIESRVLSLTSHDKYNRPTITIEVANMGPEIALDVAVVVKQTFKGPPNPDGWWTRPSTTPVAERLGANKNVHVRIPAAPERLDQVEVEWRDSEGKHSIHPQLRKASADNSN